MSRHTMGVRFDKIGINVSCRPPTTMSTESSVIELSIRETDTMKNGLTK